MHPLRGNMIELLQSGVIFSQKNKGKGLFMIDAIAFQTKNRMDLLFLGIRPKCHRSIHGFPIGQGDMLQSHRFGCID